MEATMYELSDARTG